MKCMLEAHLLVSIIPNTLKQPTEQFRHIIRMMNKYIFSVFILVCALVATAHCGAYGYAYSVPAYETHYYAPGPKYTIQGLASGELYPGRSSYRSYHYAPTYSQVALPVVPSSPLARLYPFDANYAY